VSLSDIAGLIGAFMMLAAYAAASFGKLDPVKAPSLLMNLIGAGLVLYSLSEDFNLGAAVLEVSWGLIALAGLIKLVVGRRRTD
jgi:hypothetical protein